MKDYKRFIGEAAGEGFGKDADYYQNVKREGKKALKQIQRDNRKEAESKQETKPPENKDQKKPIGYAFSPDGPGRKGTSGRRYERERMRDTKIDAIKHQRGQRLKQRVGFVKDKLFGNVSGSVQSTGAGNSSDPSVRYQ